MRVPDQIKDCIFFLCVETDSYGNKVFQYGGTGWLVGVLSESNRDNYPCIVTAKHNVERAKNFGDIHIRLNTVDGAADSIQVTGEWIYHENETVDIAVMRFDLPDPRFMFKSLPIEIFLTSETIEQYNIGIGDDLLVVGLFT